MPAPLQNDGTTDTRRSFTGKITPSDASERPGFPQNLHKALLWSEDPQPCHGSFQRVGQRGIEYGKEQKKKRSGHRFPGENGST